jgi:septum formation protein
MLLKDKLKPYNIILASASPRRHEFLKILDFDFSVELKPIEEIYSDKLQKEEITDYLAKLKAEPFQHGLKEKDILITSDTIVWHNNTAIGKPKDEEDAFKMIKRLSNDTHEVVTSICISTVENQYLKNTVTKVQFRPLSDEAISHYIKTYKPMDKAGSYGIQDWIGAIAISSIEGSYNNVVGLPTHLLYETLNTIVEQD